MFEHSPDFQLARATTTQTQFSFTIFDSGQTTVWLQLETKVKCSEYLLRRSIRLLTFSNPFKMPERTRLKRSTGSTNPIRCKSTSTFNDDKSIIHVLILSAFLAVCCTNKPRNKLKMLRFCRTPNNRLLWAADLNWRQGPAALGAFHKTLRVFPCLPIFVIFTLLPLQIANCRLA